MTGRSGRGWRRTLGIGAVLAAVTAGMGSARAQEDSAPLGPFGAPVEIDAEQLQAWQATKAGLADTSLRRQVRRGAGGNITVEVLVEGSDTRARDAVAAVGGEVLGQVPGYLLLARVPAGRLASLEAAAGVAGVRDPLNAALPIEPIITAAGDDRATPGGHLGQTNAAAWHAAGLVGNGIKVGIIDAFNGEDWDAAVASGDVPEVSGSFCLTEGQPCDVFGIGIPSPSHGVGVAEVLHEIAPGAKLYIATVVTTTDLQAAVEYFDQQGVHIINRSQGASLDGSGRGDGPLDAVAADAVSRGMAFFNSAGNHGVEPVDLGDGNPVPLGGYYRGVFTDTDNDGLHEFATPSGPTEGLPLLCSRGNFQGLRWSDWPAGPSTTDYDLFVTDQFGTILLAGQDNQGPGLGTDPLENVDLFQICSPGFVFYLFVQATEPNGGTAGDVLEIMVFDKLDGSQNPYSATQPISDSNTKGVFSIGAVEADLAVADYSSQGPNNAEQLTPDFSARTDVNTLTYNGNFNGTSAASPSAAGLAALVWGAGLVNSPQRLHDWLKANATTNRGPAGPDNTYGNGEIVLPRPGGGGAAPQCLGQRATIVGSGRADRLNGTPGDDVIVGLGGGDTINGRGGKDRICGGAGKDTLNGAGGKDRIDGGPGRDLCRGGPGRDRQQSCER